METHQQTYKEHSGELQKNLGELERWHQQVEEATNMIKQAFEAGKTVYVAGNGGSATLAQHLSDEMVGRYSAHRKAYPVVALTTDGAVLTVIGNDYGYEEIFSRQLEALGREGDIFVGFTTSGSSKNILRAAEVAKEKGMKIIAFTGDFGVFKDMVDLAVISPAKTTNRIQELDLHAVHLICEAFEPASDVSNRKLNMDRIEELLQNFTQQRLLVVGDVMLDHYVEGVVERINPEAPVPVLKVKNHRDMTGGAGNVAKNAASLGATVCLVSVVGQDNSRVAMEEAAKNEGYTARLVEDPGRPTIRKERYLASNQQLLRIDREETHDISGEVEDKLIAEVERAFADGVHGVIVSDYAKGTITERVAEVAMKLAKKYDVPAGIDVKPSRIAHFVGATFMSPNIKEAHEYLGLNHLEKGGKSAEELGRMLYDKMQTESFITLGPDGVYVYQDHDTHYLVPQAHKVAVADVSGAGDTAVVAQMLARLSGANHEEIALLNNAAGAAVVQKVGSVGITPDELRRMLMHKI